MRRYYAKYRESLKGQFGIEEINVDEQLAQGRKVKVKDLPDELKVPA